METDGHLQKPTQLTETDRNRRKPAETDRNLRTTTVATTRWMTSVLAQATPWLTPVLKTHPYAHGHGHAYDLMQMAVCLRVLYTRAAALHDAAWVEKARQPP